ncbi:uncharacterized protein TNCV_4307661 [Trichonephila clavipes]|nr:uncharacterized protein TNCV_4307661 [Trichonephila clavipes]
MSRQKPTIYVSVTSRVLHQKWKLWGLHEYFFGQKKTLRFQYSQYYGDGDSKAFISVKDTYGINNEAKFESIGNVQKRVGSCLRKLQTKTKGLFGKGKLTDDFIDRLKNYYGIAVRSIVGDLNVMQQNVISVLYHCASSDKKPMHGQSSIAAVAEWFRYRIVACLVTSSSPVPLKTRRVGQRCTLKLLRDETFSRWCGVVVRREGCQLRCHPRHLTMVQNYVVRRQKPSCS